MNNQSLIQAVRREAESCQNAFTEPHQNPEYRTPFHAIQIMLENLAKKLKDEADVELLDKAGARRIHLESHPELAPTLRDQFAMAALNGLSVNQEFLLNNDDLMRDMGTNGIDKLQADKAYRLADAMMERRKQ